MNDALDTVLVLKIKSLKMHLFFLPMCIFLKNEILFGISLSYNVLIKVRVSVEDEKQLTCSSSNLALRYPMAKDFNWYLMYVRCVWHETTKGKQLIFVFVIYSDQRRRLTKLSGNYTSSCFYITILSYTCKNGLISG